MRNYGVVVLMLLATAGAGQAKEKTKSLHDQFTGQGYGPAGCGLGSVLIGDKPGAVQIFAVTSNNFAGNQTFGISSGTLNCEEDADESSNAVVQKIHHMVAENRHRLEQEAAQGRGETIAALASLAHCQDGAALGSSFQQHYAEIFSPSTPVGEISQRLLPIMKNNNCNV